jgi:hypothetical protein
VSKFNSEKNRSHLVAHISGILGIAPLLSFFKNVVEWRTFIVQFILWWQSHVRPFLHSMFGWIAEIWPWRWPEWGYDYIVFSFLFAFGGVRFFQIFFPIRDREGFVSISFWSGGRDSSVSQRINIISRQSIQRLILLFVLVFLLWPIFLILLILYVLVISIADGFSRPLREALFLALSPFIYFAFIVAVNYALFFADIE